jgi:hypothetical protein
VVNVDGDDEFRWRGGGCGIWMMKIGWWNVGERGCCGGLEGS